MARSKINYNAEQVSGKQQSNTTSVNTTELKNICGILKYRQETGERVKPMQFDNPEITSKIFYPRKAREPLDLPERCDALHFSVSAFIQLGGFFFLNDRAFPTLLLFHGNGEIVHDYLQISREYMACGVNFAVIDYRGYGFSGGESSFKYLFTDCFAAFDGIVKYLKERSYNGEIFVLGRSLGSICAAELASKTPPGLQGVIFESGVGSTFLLMRDLFGLVGPDFSEEKMKPWSNDTRIAKFKKPVLIIHGTADRLVPVKHASIIFDAVPHGVYKKKVLIDGAGHNDIQMWNDEYFPPLKEFIQKFK
ncbi:MAG TPA: alpha/beta fold hydrolase [Candidatus Lokiarchaeia archaeon]|nr:alpha/beta fold hydrolase [Candidatus Lokiarchaeia archaeon]